MAVPSDARLSVRMTPTVLALCLVGGIWPAAVSAQTPGDSEPPLAVEMWQGNRRVTPDRPASAPPPEIAPLAVPASGVVPAMLPAGPVAAKGEVDEIQRLIRSTRQLTDECRSAIKTCRATVSKARLQADEAMTVPTRVAPESIRLIPVPTVTDPAPPREPPAPSRPADGITWGQIAVLAGAALSFPAMLVLLAALLIRRTGVQFRVEFLNSAPLFARVEGAPAPAPAPGTVVTGKAIETAPGEPTAEVVQETPTAPQEPEPTAEQFDLGPTYEEERLAQEEARRQQELALLEQLVEDNCRLLEEISALETDTALPDVDSPSDDEWTPEAE